MPQLSFIYAYPLDGTRRRIFKVKNFGDYPESREVQLVAKHWETLWEGLNKDDKIIKALVDITQRTPIRALECFVFGAGLNPMSTPLLMPIRGRGNVRRTDEAFIQTLIHELLHIFVSTDNQNYQEFISKKYEKEDISTQHHIIIYAMLYELYQQLFASVPPDFSEEDLPPSYLRALEIVKEEGSQNILKDYNKLL